MCVCAYIFTSFFLLRILCPPCLVADQDGLPTSASHLAVLLRARGDQTRRSCGGCGQRQLITCHMTPSSKTFLLQQALVLISAHEDIAGENLSGNVACVMVIGKFGWSGRGKGWFVFFYGCFVGYFKN